MATVELCEGSVLGTGFQLHIGLAEIHVPRMWVENDKGHSVREKIDKCTYSVLSIRYTVYVVNCCCDCCCMCTCTTLVVFTDKFLM